MTPEQLKTDITAWCNEKTGLQLVEDRADTGAALSLGLRAGAGGSATVPVDVRLDQDDDRVAIVSTAASAEDTQEVEKLLAARPALVRADTSGGATVLTAYVYLDGLNKQSFIAAVEEVAKTRGLVDGLADNTASSYSRVDAVAATPAATPQPAQPATPTQPWSSSSLPQESVQPAASSLPAPSFATPASSYTPQPQPAQPAYTPQPAQQAYSPQPAAQAQPQPQPAAFAPTHTVPPQGMQAWAAPDPNGAVVATLGGGLPIQVTEVRGAWANIVCSNGWTGWVDGRIIGVAR